MQSELSQQLPSLSDSRVFPVLKRLQLKWQNARVFEADAPDDAGRANQGREPSLL